MDPAGSTFYPIEEIYGMMKGKKHGKKGKDKGREEMNSKSAQ